MTVHYDAINSKQIVTLKKQNKKKKKQKKKQKWLKECLR